MPLVDTLTVTAQDPRRAKLEGGKPLRARLRVPARRRPADRHRRARRGRPRRASATRCCSAPPAPARPSPSPRSSRRPSARRSSSPRTRPSPPSSTASSRASSRRTRSSTSSRYYDYYQPEAYVPRTDTYIEKESPDQRADRPDAPLGDPGAARARRRHHRRLGLLHLRHRLGRDLRRDDPGPDRRARPTTSAR